MASEPHQDAAIKLARKFADGDVPKIGPDDVGHLLTAYDETMRSLAERNADVVTLGERGREVLAAYDQQARDLDAFGHAISDQSRRAQEAETRAERAEAAIERVRTYGEQRLRELQAMVDSQVTDRGKRSVAEALEFTVCDIHTLLSYLGSVPSDATFPQYPVTTHAPDEPLPVDAEWNGVKDEEDWRLRVLSYDLDPDALPMPAPPFRSVTAAQIASGYQAAKSAIEADR